MQIAIVAILVTMSVLFSLWRLIPAERRLRLLQRIAPGAAKRGDWIGRLWRAAQAQALRGCQACAHGAARIYRGGRP